MARKRFEAGNEPIPGTADQNHVEPNRTRYCHDALGPKESESKMSVQFRGDYSRLLFFNPRAFQLGL
jgi:hypothetical protein